MLSPRYKLHGLLRHYPKYFSLRATDKAAGLPPLTEGPWVLSRSVPRQDCGAQSGTVTNISLKTSVFLRHCHIIAPWHCDKFLSENFFLPRHCHITAPWHRENFSPKTSFFPRHCHTIAPWQHERFFSGNFVLPTTLSHYCSMAPWQTFLRKLRFPLPMLYHQRSIFTYILILPLPKEKSMKPGNLQA
jgi:hypothetical protein